MERCDLQCEAAHSYYPQTASTGATLPSGIPSDAYFPRLLNEIFTIIGPVLLYVHGRSQVFKARENSLQAEREGKQFWPMPQQLLPFPPEDALQSLISWTTVTYVDPLSILGALTGLQLICQVYISRALFNLPSFPRYVSSCVTALRALKERAMPSNSPSVVSEALADGIFEFSFWVSLVSELGRGEYMLEALDHAISTDLLDFCNQSGSTIARLLLNDRILSDEDRFCALRKSHQLIAHLGGYLLSRNIELKGSLRHHLRRSMDVQIELKNDPANGIAVAYDIFLAVHHCFGPGCLKTFYTEERCFSKCNRCLTIQYCSRSCQEAGWRSKDMPHKELCKQMRAMVDACGHIPASRVAGQKIQDLDRLVACLKQAFPQDWLAKLNEQVQLLLSHTV